jgi:hypothetical protein
MTVSEVQSFSDLPSSVTLVLASRAAPYIEPELARELAQLDGSPVYLVDDGETGTSDAFVMEAKSRLWADQGAEGTVLNEVLTWCFAHRVSFRIWPADGTVQPHVAQAQEVHGLSDTFEALKTNSGAWWHANSTPHADAVDQRTASQSSSTPALGGRGR